MRLPPGVEAELRRRIAELNARYPPGWPLACFVCREPVLETFKAYPCCDECLDALIDAPGIGQADVDQLRAERAWRWLP